MNNWLRVPLDTAGLCGREAQKLPSNVSADELMKYGHQFIDNCDYDSAFVVGQRLKRIDFTGGFEVVARTYAA